MNSKIDLSKLDDSICSISCYTKHNRNLGNGAFIAPNKVLTAWHVITGSRDIVFRNSNDDLSWMKKGGDHCKLEKSDLAIVELEKPIGDHFLQPTATTSIPLKGYLVTHFRGYRNDCIEVNLNTELTDKTLRENFLLAYNPKAKIVSGHSGSPLVDEDGNIFSIAHAVRITADICAKMILTDLIEEEYLSESLPVPVPHPSDTLPFIKQALPQISQPLKKKWWPGWLPELGR